MKSTHEKVKEQVKSRTPDSIIDLISSQLEIAIEAKRRYDDEGIVVRDMKGCVVAHPAIKIEQDATKLAEEMLGKYKG